MDGEQCDSSPEKMAAPCGIVSPGQEKTTVSSVQEKATVSPDVIPVITCETSSAPKPESGTRQRKGHDSGRGATDTKKDDEYPKNPKKESADPTPRACFKDDQLDRDYDNLPWLLGAISRLLGLKIAPIHVPWYRRMETLAVLSWMSMFLGLGIASTFALIYVFLYTQYWWVSLCYLCWYIPDRTVCNRGGRRVNWVRRLGIWKHYRNFFPITVVKTEELDPDHNYLMCYHPHGLLCAGAFCTFATEGCNFAETFPGLTPYLLTLEVLHLLPIYRELLLCSGTVSATRASMDHLLGREGTGRALCLVPGGAPESLDCHPGLLVLHLNERKGFIKMALRHGASLVPMFAFGENDVYDQLSNPPGSLLRRVQDKMQKIFSIPPCIFMGRGVFQYSLGIVPYRKPIFVVIGSPIHLDPVKQPTNEQILSLHGRYKQAVVDLYNKHKYTYARDPTVPLQFV